MKYKHILLTLSAWLALGSFRIFASEYIDTNGDGSNDTLVLETFVVNGNDPATFDWEGFFKSQILDQLTTNVEYVTVTINGGSAGGTVAKNGGGGVALIANPDPNATGYVRSNGYGAYSIVINESMLDPIYRNNATILAIIRESMTVHENYHVTVALNRNPAIFGGDSNGWVLSISNPLRNGNEVSAYTTERTWLQGVINAGQYNGTSLTSGEISILEAYKSDLNANITLFGGTP